MSEHLRYMQRASVLAQQARGMTSPNPMVGAVIVKGRRVIAEGWHQRCGEAHAEINALKMAGSRAKGATMYVTLEPCAHTGRTGPCVEAIIKAGIKKVVIGAWDPNPLTHKRSLGILRKAGVEVEHGIMADELTRMNEVFNKYITRQMPFVVAKCAQTLDGKTALANGRSKWITGTYTRDYARGRRREFDAIMVGINTVLKDDPRLDAPGRFKPVIKIVVDSALRLPLKSRLLAGSSLRSVIVATTDKASLAKASQLKRRGVEVLVSPKMRGGGVDLKWLMRQLAVRQIAHLLIEGGSTLIGSALKHGLIDRMMIYIAPKIMGDPKALGSVTGSALTSLDQAFRLKRVFIKNIDEDILVEGDVVYGDH